MDGKHALYDMLVLEFLEETDLANSGTRHPLILRLETNLFQRDNGVGRGISCFVNDPIGSYIFYVERSKKCQCMLGLKRRTGEGYEWLSPPSPAENSVRTPCEE